MLFSNGWFCITTQLFIKISFRPRTAGWYVVTKGKTFVWVFFLFWRANLLSSKRTPVRDLSMKLLGYPRALRRNLKFERHSSKVVCEEFVLRSLVASPLIKPRSFYTRRVAGGEMRVLEGFCRLLVGLDVEDRVSLKSIPFVYYCVKESNFVL